MLAIRMTAYGGPEVLELAEVEDPVPGPTDLVVRLAAAGVNFVDIYRRTGLYLVDLPAVPGLEGAGTVLSLGHEVTRFRVGDRVAWSGVPGSYAEKVRVPEQQAVAVPNGVDLDVAAAVMLQGMTAHFLAIDTYPLREGERCLVHAGAGGVGHLLIQIAKLRGAEVFSTAGSAEKATVAKEAGASHVILYREVDFAEAISSIAGPRSIDVVYDGVGKETFQRGLDVLRRRGLMASFGNASGPVDPIAPLVLSQKGSLYLTRPALGDYIATRAELERRAGDLFGWIEAGLLRVRIGARVPLGQAAEAHRLVESRQTTGKVLLVP
jgi:NADPH2:quinone reductase